MKEINQVKPFISFLLVTRNESKYINQSLSSMINQTYPKDRYEIIIVDGESNDGTLDVVNTIIEKTKKTSPELSIKLFSNPMLILSSGWNIGIEHSLGEYVVRIDAHAVASPSFLEKSVETMTQHDAICVGGKLITESLPGDNEVVSKVLSSPFGVGNSSFRVSNKEGYADTAVYGLYKKSVFKEVGYFDENFVRNQDMEFHSRIKKHGGKFYFNPEITCIYYSRNTVKKMLKQSFLNGKWNMVLLKKNAKGPSLRHLIPFAFVLYLLFSIGLGFIWHPLWFICLGVVAVHIILGFCFAIVKTKRIIEILQMPFLFVLLHLTYGFGFFAGIFTRRRYKNETLRKNS